MPCKPCAVRPRSQTVHGATGLRSDAFCRCGQVWSACAQKIVARLHTTAVQEGVNHKLHQDGGKGTASTHHNDDVTQRGNSQKSPRDDKPAVPAACTARPALDLPQRGEKIGMRHVQERPKLHTARGKSWNSRIGKGPIVPRRARNRSQG